MKGILLPLLDFYFLRGKLVQDNDADLQEPLQTFTFGQKFFSKLLLENIL